MHRHGITAELVALIGQFWLPFGDHPKTIHFDRVLCSPMILNASSRPFFLVRAAWLDGNQLVVLSDVDYAHTSTAPFFGSIFYRQSICRFNLPGGDHSEEFETAVLAVTRAQPLLYSQMSIFESNMSPLITYDTEAFEAQLATRPCDTTMAQRAPWRSSDGRRRGRQWLHNTKHDYRVVEEDFEVSRKLAVYSANGRQELYEMGPDLSIQVIAQVFDDEIWVVDLYEDTLCVRYFTFSPSRMVWVERYCSFPKTRHTTGSFPERAYPSKSSSPSVVFMREEDAVCLVQYLENRPFSEDERYVRFHLVPLQELRDEASNLWVQHLSARAVSSSSSSSANSSSSERT